MEMEAWKTVTPCLRSEKHWSISQFYKETFLTFVFDLVWNVSFSNSLIIHVAFTQPENLILVRWMGLETRWNPVSSVWYIFSIETKTD